MFDISFGGAALAGILSFLSPCILPMVPFYLCYMAGLSMAELRSDQGLAPGAQRRLVLSSIAFALGVTSIFMLLGLGATALGQAFIQWKDTLRWVAAAVLLAEASRQRVLAGMYDRPSWPEEELEARIAAWVEK